MKNIKIIFSLFLIVVIASISAIAQPKDKGDRMQKKLETLTQKLDLTEKQQAEIKTIFEKSAQKRKAIASQEGDRKSKKEAFKAHREEDLVAIKAVLNQKQLVTFQEMTNKKKAHHEALKNVDKKALKAETKAYHQKNILPVLMSQRQKLEVKISTEDKKKIAEIRTVFQELKAEGKKLKGDKKGKKGRKALSEADKQAFKALKERKKAQMTAVKSLLEKYEKDIKPLKEEINPQIESWKTDLRAIAEKHGVQPRNRDNKKADNPKKALKHGKKGKHKRRHHNKQSLRKLLSPVHFLLMDVNASPEKTAMEAASSSMRVYPNPAQGQNTIEFELATSGTFSLELHDTKGNLVQVIDRGYKEAGTYKEQVNLGGLKDYVYFYILKDATGNILTEKFLIKK